jgi:hypothetical protein
VHVASQVIQKEEVESEEGRLIEGVHGAEV